MKNIVKLFAIGMVTFFVVSNPISFGFSKQTTDSAYITSVKASHILVDTKKEADSLKSKIDKGEHFEVLAMKYSKCPSGQNGGDLGYFRRGQMVKEFQDAAFNLPVGEVSEPVQTQFGWHIIKVYGRK